VSDLLAPEDVARILKVSVRTVRRLTSRGELRAVYPGRFPRYTEREVEAYIASLSKRRRVA
jgi:excisionase family DNA binding protein